MKTQISLTLRFRLEAETSKYVKIKSHKRVINGKVVKIRNATSDFPRKSAVQKKQRVSRTTPNTSSSSYHIIASVEIFSKLLKIPSAKTMRILLLNPDHLVYIPDTLSEASGYLSCNHPLMFGYGRIHPKS